MERYDPIRILGEGSFGKVYLMRDKVKKNLICVKIIKIKNIPKKEREATKVEVDLLRRLHHPNIVRYIDSFLLKNNESLCICMEYCDGGDLASQIKAARRNLFSENKVLHWFVQIALGLHYMHNNKVLHRDLKTQNIFLLGNGRLVLGDLGISKVLDGTMDFAQTCIGTPYYMSPEIFKNKPYSYKSDVWALGCVLYEMTTLTHAFDANSLNGLAGKIIKGRYPPIHHKYSKFLRDLISDMLMTNPQQRPDLDQILRKPFIKKHIVNFFVDVMSRPSGSIGEGTMIVRAAVGGPAPSALSNDSNMLAFKQQLQQLDMMDAVNEALSPKSIPTDVNEAKKLAKEQISALKREEDHKKMVEAALEKLRQERESRARDRATPPARVLPPQNRPVPSPSPSPKQGAGNNAMFGAKQPIQNPISNGRKDPVNVGPIDAMGVIAREKMERERRLAEEARRRQLAIEQDARERAEERRREETRLEAKQREEARQREESRLREESIAKQRQEQLRLQADAAARRDLQRQRERERQQEEIEQLRRDKLELDRRAQERDRLRNDRRADERRRLEENRKELESNPSISNQSSGASEKFGPRPRGEESRSRLLSDARAEEKDSLSARDRVLQRKQDKLAKDEQDRLEALREAENANRLLRLQANQQNYNLYHANAANNGLGPPSNIVTPKSQVGKGRFAYPGDEDISNPAPYEFDAARNKGRPNMDLDELSKKLSEASTGKPARYDSGENILTPAYASRVSPRPAPIGGGYFSDRRIEDFSDDGTASEGEDDNMWEQRPVSSSDAEEAIHNREEELQAELQMTTMRLEEIKKTLKETKNVLGPKVGAVGKPVVSNGNPAPLLDEEYFDDEEDEFDETVDYDEEDGWRNPVVPTPKGGRGPSDFNDGPRSPRQGRNYENLQDIPTPSGRLSDRIQLIRQRCIDALGKEAFSAAYNYLKFNQFESDVNEFYSNDTDDEKMSTLSGILGIEKSHFTALIEQLIFMEESD